MLMRTYICALPFLAVLLSACGHTVSPGTSEDRDLLAARCQATLADFKTRDSSLERLLANAHAYAIFPNVIVGAAGIGGAHGDGEVFQGGKMVGYADMSQISVGAQLGGQRYAELILFQNDISFVNFTHAQYEMDARVSAIAAANGAADTANYGRGVIVFTLPDSGFMAQAAIGGQKFRYTALLRPQ